MKGDKSNLILVELHPVDVGKRMGQPDGHVVNQGILGFNLPHDGVGIAHVELATVVGLVHVQGELHEKFPVK